MKLFNWKPYLPYILSTAALVVFVVYLYRNIDRYKILINFSIESIFLLVGLSLVFTFIRGGVNYIFYQGLGLPLTLNEGIGLAIVNTLANQLPFMGGGIAVKGIYLKKRYEFAYPRYLSSLLALFVLFFAANGLVGFIVLIYMALVQGTTIPTILFLGFLGMAISILLFWIPVNINNLNGKWGQRLAKLLEGWQVLSQDYVLLLKLVGLQVLTVLLFAGRYWGAFHGLSQDVTLPQCILFSSASILTSLVNITPGALGIREAIVAGLAYMLGFDAGASVIAVGIDRLIALAVVIPLGVIYTYVLSNKATKQANSIESDMTRMTNHPHSIEPAPDKNIK
jgi:uncharacterized membrane protein YbhN (UPF0104 family)